MMLGLPGGGGGSSDRWDLTVLELLLLMLIDQPEIELSDLTLSHSKDPTCIIRYTSEL